MVANRGVVSIVGATILVALFAMILPAQAGDTGFTSAKGAHFDFAGEFEFEFLSPGEDASDENQHFQVDKFVFQPKLKVGDGITASAQIYVTEGSAYLNEAHVKFVGLPGGSWIDAGHYERWLKSHHGRKTEGYSLMGTAFYRDDSNTVTLGGESGPAFWMFSAGHGLDIGSKQVAEDSYSDNKFMHDDTGGHGDVSDAMEIGANVGFKTKVGDVGNIDVMGFYYMDELSETDIDTLGSKFPSYADTSNTDKTRFGVSAKATFSGATVYGGFVSATDGEIDRTAWVAEAWYHIKHGSGGDWFTGCMPVVSYSDYKIDADQEKDVGKPWSWDRQKLMVACIVDLYKNTKLKVEYYKNSEDMGDAAGDDDELENDEFLVQLEFKF